MSPTGRDTAWVARAVKVGPRLYEGGEREPSSATHTGFVDIDGVRLAWTRGGRRAGPSVLLAHGLTDSAACWNPLAEALAPSYDVVRYDARGHGASDRATDYSFERHTDEVVRLARAMRLDRPILIGHSMGGAHAAVAAPELDARAVIVEDPPWPEVPDDGTKDVAASRRSVIEVAALTEAQRGACGRAEHPTWADVDLRAWVEAQGHVDPDVVSWFDCWPTTNCWRDHVSELHCPGLLLIGDHTRVTSRAAAEATERWAQLEVVQVQGAGHNIRRDQFEPYWRAVDSFLKAGRSGLSRLAPRRGLSRQR